MERETAPHNRPPSLVWRASQRILRHNSRSTIEFRSDSDNLRSRAKENLGKSQSKRPEASTTRIQHDGHWHVRVAESVLPPRSALRHMTPTSGTSYLFPPILPVSLGPAAPVGEI